MRRFAIAFVWMASACTMPNPAFEDGEFADAGSGSDERVESSDAVGESGSGSGDSSTSSDSQTESSDGSDESESSESESAESESAESESSESESSSESTDTIDTSDSESTETGFQACLELIPADDCQACQIESCCTEATFSCFDPQNAEDCQCLLGCLSLGGLVDLCGLQCGVGMLLSNVADTVNDCVLEACGQAC